MRVLVPEVAGEFERKVGVSLDSKNLPFSILKVMKKLGCEVSEIWEGEIKWSWDRYKILVLNVLMEGVNCAGLEFPDCGDEVREWYREGFLRRVMDASART